MRIGELAHATGVSVRSLRYYEEQGLLASERSPSGQRHYPERAAERVGLIQQLFAAGLNSATMGELLPCILATSTRTAHLSERLQVERERIDRTIAGLILTRAALDAVIADSGPNVPVAAETARTVSVHLS